MRILMIQIEQVSADGAYDQRKCYDELSECSTACKTVASL